MIGHDHFRKLAAWAIDQPLARDEERELAAHRSGCDACRTFDDGLRADAIAMALRRELLPGAALDRRVEAALYGVRPHGQLSPLAVLLILGVMLVAAASAVVVGGSLLNRDQVRLPERPAVPDGWTTILASSRDLRLTLPGYLGAQDVDGTVYANEVPVGDANWFGLMAAGPASAAQPRAGQSLESWLRSFLSQAPLEEIESRPISLPAGNGVELRALAAEGTRDETQVVLYAIQTDDGAAFLWLTGRPEDFVNHAADLRLIPQLLETGPALTAALPPEPPGFELRLAVPSGWRQLAAPAQTNDGPQWKTFVSNVPFAEDLCEPQSDGTLACSQTLGDGAAAGTFVLGVIEIRGGVPRSPIDSPSLPPGVHHATVARHPAIRTDELVANTGEVELIWEVLSPGEPSGVFVIRMVAAADGYLALLPQVELMLQDAEFVVAGASEQ
jgi:hypothetical protein